MYHNCNVAGEKSTVKMNGCEYHFVVGGVHSATAQIKCPAGKSIEIEEPLKGCLITVGSTAVLGGGLTFHDAETNKVLKTEVTVETTVTNIPTTINNKCPIKEGAAASEITTWNFELTAEEDNALQKHVELFWT